LPYCNTPAGFEDQRAYETGFLVDIGSDEGGCAMAVLIRRYKGHNGMMQEERIDDDDRIERYFRLFEKDDVKKLETGVKVFIEKDEWQLLP
jgi:hypothetical protein